ncbi:6975_t:CDS:1 [Acaulospora morrowiae]|uniref:6975_t:CDS:1 n=1 Tax=Acaulospora morrowiae TaxID=94023 RepID=A0A9N9E621_9GLOM|nr:6975_t:CDS:1 [Acaulospora morrowiae]
MTSNFTYSSLLSSLSSLDQNSINASQDDDLSLWATAEFSFDIPPVPVIGMMDEEFDVSPAENKFEDSDVAYSTALVQTEIPSFTNQTQNMYHPLLSSYPTASSLIQTRLQPIPIAPAVTPTTQANYSPIYPTPLTAGLTTAAKVGNKVIALKEENGNTSKSSTTKATINPPSRKNSAKSVQSSTDTTGTNSTAEDIETQKEDPEMAAKIAAEEDKRRRNTAASARFRVKKKMREQALERTAKEMTQKAETLEVRVKELEMEIKWLRSLIVEKDARLLDIDRPEKKRKTDSENSDETLRQESNNKIDKMG